MPHWLWPLWFTIKVLGWSRRLCPSSNVGVQEALPQSSRLPRRSCGRAARRSCSCRGCWGATCPCPRDVVLAAADMRLGGWAAVDAADGVRCRSSSLGDDRLHCLLL